MTGAFMAAYERAEEKHNLQHGWFYEKKQERARKKRNQRIAGLATIGAGIAAGAGLAAYSGYKDRARRDKEDIDAMKKTAESLHSKKRSPNPKNADRVDKILNNLGKKKEGSQ